MKNKYEMRICKCGRFHMVEYTKLKTAINNNKNLLLICAGCGKATIIGADTELDYYEPGKPSYVMYACDFSDYDDRIINVSDFTSTKTNKGIEEIIYSHGYRVPMMSGMYATDYSYGEFSDRWYPDFYKIQRSDITVKEIMEFIDTYTHDRTTVNMNRFIRETPDEILDEISRFMIKGLNFRGTKWETEWNSNDTES